MNEKLPLPSAAADRREVESRVGAEMAARLAAIDLVVLDCDGVLTDGSLHYGPAGELFKTFDARDGLGLLMLRAAGLARAMLTGRCSTMVRRRCDDLGFEAVKMDRFDKLAAVREIQAETGRTVDETLYMGDDLLDLPAFEAAALIVTVPEAPPAVRAASDLITRAPGGRGAVREVCDLLLMARGAYAAAIADLITSGRPDRCSQEREP